MEYDSGRSRGTDGVGDETGEGGLVNMVELITSKDVVVEAEADVQESTGRDSGTASDGVLLDSHDEDRVNVGDTRLKSAWRELIGRNSERG